jgi:hypothetical protein
MVKAGLRIVGISVRILCQPSRRTAEARLYPICGICDILPFHRFQKGIDVLGQILWPDIQYISRLVTS